MRYCPNCKLDYEDTVTECKWCEVELVSDLNAFSDISEKEMPADLFEGETETVFTTLNPLQAAKIEEAMKKAGIPVQVRPAKEQTEETVEEETDEEETVEEETVEEETVEEETAEEEPVKKGFLARLFSKKKKEKKPAKEDDGYRFTRGGMVLDITVPASFASEAYAVLNKTLGIAGATDDWHYDDAETVSELLAAEDEYIEEDDLSEDDHEADELTQIVEEDFGDDF